ncbi:unnamed protein product, partial [Nesidiocoris tenuis]
METECLFFLKLTNEMCKRSACASSGSLCLGSVVNTAPNRKVASATRSKTHATSPLRLQCEHPTLRPLQKPYSPACCLFRGKSQVIASLRFAPNRRQCETSLRPLIGGY